MDPETIQFGTPLTLIVGQNGTGKTTIIECLRYATTGDLPPNSKGGAFLHDPKISRDREVTGQIKLAFHNINGTQMICTRSMQLTVKKTATTFKTLEGQLLAFKDGERRTVSTRVGELDAQMPLYLGVSRAILDHVIFCHQEDSLWPLAEPSVVKKRFDDIFEATKFTKALDNIKTLRKDYTVAISLQDKEVQHLKSDKDRAERTQRQVDVLESGIAELNSEAESLAREMAVVNQQSNRLFHSNQEFQAVLHRAEALKKEQQACKESVARILSDLDDQVSDQSDAELDKLLASVGERTAKSQEKISALEKGCSDLITTIKAKQHNHKEALASRGQLRAEAEAYDKAARSRLEFAQSSGLVDAADLNSESVLTLFKEKLDTKLSQLQIEVDRERNDINKTENIVNRHMQELTATKLEHNQTVLTGRETVASCDREMADIQREINNSTVDESRLAYETEDLASLQRKLHQSVDEFGSKHVDEDIKAKQQTLAQVEAQIEQHQADLSRYNHQADSRANLSYLKDDLAKRTAALESLIRVNSEAFSFKVDPETVDSNLRDETSKAQDQVNELSTTYEGTRHKLSQLEAQVAASEDNVRVKTMEARRLREAVTKVLSPESIVGYDDYIRELDEDMNTATKNLEGSGFLLEFFSTALKSAKDEHTCHLCARSFQVNSDQLEEFEQLLVSRLEKLPSKAEAEQQVKETAAERETAVKMGPSVKNLLALEDVEIPAASAQLANLKSQLSELELSAESESRALDAARGAVRQLESLRRIAGDITRSHRDIAGVQAQIRELEGELNQDDGGLSLGDVQKEITGLNSRVKELRREIDELSLSRETHRNAVANSEKRIAKKTVELRDLQDEIKALAQKKERLEQLQRQRAQAELAISSGQASMADLEPQIKAQKETLQQARVESHTRQKTLAQEISRLQEMRTEFVTMSKHVDEYVSRGRAQELDKVEQRVTALESEIAALESEHSAMEKELKEEEAAIADVRSYERNLRDNVRLREERKRLAQLSDESNRLDVATAQSQRDRYQQQAEDMRRQHDRLAASHSEKLGQAKQMDNELQRLKLELSTEFSRIQDDYKMAVIKLQTTALANDDLAKYSKALDSAIMKFHSMKMEEINRIVDELWKKTYTGTDVDTIVIRSEHDPKGNRAYNYRVSMVKSDVELDMRGRCSAGQKVLACIIIRLALSECFGTNCGLIALDEPTTNLDASNTASLARALDTIISVRRAQRNFQLVVITHDETFLSHMNAASYTDHFFRVSRDERQVSQIRCVPISRVVE